MDEKTVFQPGSHGSVRPGVRLNGIYEIERLIAQGGMGEVYRGFAIETRDPVAIKMIRPELSSNPDAMALFRREASILHNLQHDAIVRYYVFSIDPELQRAYLSMEYVDGPSLSKRLAAGPLSLAEARLLAQRIGGALDAAHRLGVIHRDMSSDNIILPGGDVRRAKVIDFGIARSHRPGEGTIIGDGFAGKYNYVSPEQLGLAGGDVTAKSDIYSFGLVLAEALRGRPIDMGGSQVEIIEKRRKVPDLSDIDAAMRPLLQAMLQPLPADRPESMAAVAASGEAQTPWPRGLPARPAEAAAKPANQGRGVGLAIALAAALALLSLAGAAYVFRDDLKSALAPLLGGKSSQIAATPPGGPQGETPPNPPPLGPQGEAPPKPPPLGPTGEGPVNSPPVHPEGETPPNPPSGSATSASNLPTGGEPSGGVLHPQTKEEWLDAMPPRAPMSSLALAGAKVGAPYRVDLPAFADPGGKGLTLKVDPALPAGLALKDFGGGKASIEGVPTAAGPSTFAVVALNHAGQSARMTASLTVGEPPAPPPPAPAEPPRPARPLAEAEAATVGQDYRFALPAFQPGANAHAVTLRAEPAPPEGLTFADLGAGAGQLSGRAAKSGAYAFDVVAVNEAGLTARMAVRIVVAPATKPSLPPPPSPKPPVTLEPATVGRDYIADLPPFDAGPKAHGLALRVEPAPPDGLTFADLGGGMSQISGKPARDGAFAFDVVGAVEGGAETRRTFKLAVAPAPAQTAGQGPTQGQQQASLGASDAPPPGPDKAAAFLGGYDGGACFYAAPAPGAASADALFGFGADPAAFQRFEAAYKAAVGAEPKVRARLVVAPECPALDLLRLGGAGLAPRIALESAEIGRGMPLAGAISGIGGRKVTVLAIDNDGVAYRLEPKPGASADSVAVYERLNEKGTDASSIGPPQVLMAIVSEAPLPALDGFRHGPARDLAAKLAPQWAAARATSALDVFKLTN